MKVEGYGESDSPTWLWPAVLLTVAVLVCGTVCFGGYVALRLMQPAPSPSPSPYPSPYTVPAIDPSAPLAADPLYAAQAQQTQQMLTGNPLAGDVRDTLWGLAVAVDQSRGTVKSPAMLTGLVEKAGAIHYGGKPEIPPTLAGPLDAVFLSVLGTEPTEIDDTRRARIIAGLRAMAYGADLAAGG